MTKQHHGITKKLNSWLQTCSPETKEHSHVGGIRLLNTRPNFDCVVFITISYR